MMILDRHPFYNEGMQLIFQLKMKRPYLKKRKDTEKYNKYNKIIMNQLMRAAQAKVVIKNNIYYNLLKEKHNIGIIYNVR